MGSHVSCYVAYGIQVELAEGAQRWEFSDARPQKGLVMPMQGGGYDEDDFFLAIPETFKDLEPGEPVFVGPYQGSEDQYLTWDGLLVAAAEELKLPVMSRPAWIFVPDRS